MHLPIYKDTLRSYVLHQLFSTNHVPIHHLLWVFLIIIQMITTSTKLYHNNCIIILFIIILSISRLFHIAALVGPFHKKKLYWDVNYYGTLRIIEGCKKYQVKKLVYSSSPSTCFTGGDVEGLSEDQMPIPDKCVALYAETKAKGEKAVSQTCCNTLLTVSVAPHQLYGPYDSLFLPKILEAAGSGKLRIFGTGQNKISLCHIMTIIVSGCSVEKIHSINAVLPYRISMSLQMTTTSIFGRRSIRQSLLWILLIWNQRFHCLCGFFTQLHISAIF